MTLFAVVIAAVLIAAVFAAGPARIKTPLIPAGDNAEAGPNFLQRTGAFLVAQRRESTAQSTGSSWPSSAATARRRSGRHLIGFPWRVSRFGAGARQNSDCRVFPRPRGEALARRRHDQWIALSHVIAAIVIVVIVPTILAHSLASPVDEVQGLRYFSYGAILLIGIGTGLSNLRGQGHAHDHVHDHTCGHNHGGGKGQDPA